ncbi:MAG: hypothetical protein QNL62_14995 [Gammaproteobacteria bacterium]|nr:hypothetical protein [Gammaproteobacteria bacterium]
MKIKLLLRNLILALSLVLIVTTGVAQSTLFVFIQIPESIEPIEREEKYGDPIHRILTTEKAGKVSGGGSMLSAPQVDGTREIEWIGIDADLTKPEKGIEIVKQELIRLGAPVDTVLEIHRASEIEKLVLTVEGWK